MARHEKLKEPFVSTATLAHLKDYLFSHLHVPWPHDEPVVLLASRNGCSVRRSLITDDDVRAVFADVAGIGEVEIEVRQLFPSSGTQPIHVHIPVKEGISCRETADQEAFVLPALRPDPQEKRNTEPPWDEETSPQKCTQIASRRPVMGHSLYQIPGGPGLPCNDWAKGPELASLGLRPCFGLPWPDITTGEQPREASGSQRPTLLADPASPVSKTIGEAPPQSANLLGAVGLQEQYRELRKGLRQQQEAVEAILQEAGSDLKLRLHGRDIRKLRNTMELLHQLESTCAEDFLETGSSALWQVPEARKRLASAAMLPRKSYWESCWMQVGVFAEVAFRLYPAGDAQSPPGQSLLYLWIQPPPTMSFWFKLEIGRDKLAIARELWPENVGWLCLEVAWALLEQELTNLELHCKTSLDIQMVLLQYMAGNNSASQARVLQHSLPDRSKIPDRLRSPVRSPRKWNL
eukprot:TRINITY_DN7357_c0_g1_i2.p1 TRINITY_DN7357_c0_g1~~TRINITY_DN7357_c0_g1_i2.p1  ORF type:complete len:463 (-),score=71.01 TRINITY_DN7357_c0_g1_i2:14-1402(-)